MNEPKIARLKPYYMELKKGRKYAWCACGLSKKQPYCDGSHKGTPFEPVVYQACEEGEEVLFCGCKHTATAPFCDGAHNNLPGGYQTDDPESPQNLAIPEIDAGSGGKRQLDGNCYVLSPEDCEFEAYEGVRYCVLIDEQRGAKYQSQFYMELDRTESPVMSFGDRHVIVFVGEGEGRIEIGGREFPIGKGAGAYVRPGEACRIRSDAPEFLRLYISACPAAEDIEWLDTMSENFDVTHPERIVRTDEAQRNEMGSRFFQLLVDKSVGSDVVTQFIGNIPESKAEPHRHLYEEALIILNGRGCMWTETCKTSVGPGDVVFLPRKQVHSLQCTDKEGMDVVGVIYPGDNPSINY